MATAEPSQGGCRGRTVRPVRIGPPTRSPPI